MLRTRIIPALLVRDGSLVKTVRFGRFTYVGDPCNTVRIFNELEVDELMVLDISPDRATRGPDLRLIADIADECFMPLAYGGAIRSFSDAKAVFEVGVEKIVVNTAAMDCPELVEAIARVYGNQAVVGSVDYRIAGGERRVVAGNSGRNRTNRAAAEWASELARHGAGEILATCIDREGTWSGIDSIGVREISDAVSVPVIAQGGAGSLEDLSDAVSRGGASAVAVGSLVVFQRRGMGVLVNFPEQRRLREMVP